MEILQKSMQALFQILTYLSGDSLAKRSPLPESVEDLMTKEEHCLCLLENVKGLLSHEQGNTFKTIITTLDELWYDCEWQVLNSKDFGVHQNRERVFIVGYFRGTSRSKIFPFTKNDKLYNEQESSSSANLKSPLRAGGDKAMIEITKNVSDAQRIYDSNGIAKTLKGNGGGQGAKTGLYAIPVLTPDRKNKRQNGRRFKKVGEPSFTLTAQDRHGVCLNNSIIRGRPRYKDNKRYLKYHQYEKECPTITATTAQGDQANIVYPQIRRLTPIECERLQGFPDNWTKDLSDTQRYKCLGNAVTVNVVREIMKKFYCILTLTW